MKFNEIAEIIGYIFIAIMTVLLFVVLYTIPAWLLWNWLMPLIFGLKKITMLQTFGLLILVHMFFGISYKQSKEE